MRMAQKFGGDGASVLSDAFTSWIQGSTDLADSLKELETELYGASIANANYAERMWYVAKSVDDAVRSFAGVNNASMISAETLKSGYRAALEAASAYGDLSDSLQDAADAIKSLLDELSTEKADKFFEKVKGDIVQIADRYKRTGEIADSVKSELFFHHPELSAEERQEIVDYFSDLEKTLKSSEAEMRKALYSDNYDPDVVRAAVDSYKRAAQEIAKRTDLSMSEIVDEGLLTSVERKLESDAAKMDSQARKAARIAAASLDAYIAVIRRKASELGVSTEEMLKAVGSMGGNDLAATIVDPGKIDDAVQHVLDGSKTIIDGLVGYVSAARDAIAQIVADVKAAVSEMASSLNDVTGVSVDQAKSKRAVAPVEVSVDTKSIEAAVTNSVAAAIKAAAESMKVEPTVVFNGEIQETPELRAIADAIMPDVMTAIRNELDRQRALGIIPKPSSAC